ncbi:UDP-glycosyltransferase UGT5-like [Sitodiplosis mosellana]|uniref:UDP-glycosyltransferase UGT5-like n=1 Tax=Sitodiplosis mosellana TaxID=263140 RepID=UPI0024439477|nr:UDP-glycosyltransferase UGT5-like [Sitodiplosis mosellana]
MKVYVLALILLSVIGAEVNSYKILGVLHIPSKSHYIVMNSLMRELALRGHEVTVITAFKAKSPLQNYEEIFMENSLSDAIKSVRSDNFVNLNNLPFWNRISTAYDASMNFTKFTTRNERFHSFLREDRHFDVVIANLFVGDAMMALGQYYNAPIIAFSTTIPSKWTSDLVGLSHFSSHVPNIISGFSDKMNFWERVTNSLEYWFEDIATVLYYRPKQQKLLEEYWPNKTDVPRLDQVLRNISLVFVNSHVTLTTPQPLAPNLIEIGGIHVNQSSYSLNEDVQTFLNDAKDGAIFFSLGSNIKLSKMSDRVKAIVANSFAEFPNVRILIKNEENFVIPSHKPSDVLVKPWYNQQEILSHPNLKLFCTHGGLLSTIEAVYFGKPIVGIPVFYDQHVNAKLAEFKGYGVSVPYERLNEDNLKSAIRSVLTNPSYANTARLISGRYHSQMNSPMETAIHWVEHIAKFKGAPHLRSAGIDQPFYVYYSLDCWSFIIFVCSLVLLIIFKTIKCVVRLFPFTKPIKAEKLKTKMKAK